MAFQISTGAALLLADDQIENGLTVELFKEMFPEFKDVPDGTIIFYIRLGMTLLRQCRWKNMWPYGLALFTAHHLALAQRELDRAEAGGAPGIGTYGLQTSKAVDNVSAGYDYGRVAYEGAGFWNTTMYGIRYWQLLRMVGMGGIQL